MIKATAAIITLAVSAIFHLYALLAGVLSAWAQEQPPVPTATSMKAANKPRTTSGDGAGASHRL